MEPIDFGVWYRDEHPRLIAAMLLVCGDLDEAREATDEALARALERWSRISRMASPAGWTYRVALNWLRRRQRRRSLERRLLQKVPPTPHVPPPAGEAWEVVSRLPDRQRTAVVLRYAGGLSEQEIGEAMGVSRGTVSSTLSDARKTLGRLLADEHAPLEINSAPLEINHG